MQLQKRTFKDIQRFDLQMLDFSGGKCSKINGFSKKPDISFSTKSAVLARFFLLKKTVKNIYIMNHTKKLPSLHHQSTRLFFWYFTSKNDKTWFFLKSTLVLTNGLNNVLNHGLNQMGFCEFCCLFAPFDDVEPFVFSKKGFPAFFLN